MNNIPSGTVTFLFTDIEGSTKLAQEHPELWEAWRERHHAILQFAIDAHHGHVFQIIGDAFCAAFHTAKDGLNAALDAQRKLQTKAWGETPIRVRMGLHTGAAEYHENGYRGYLTMARVQRVMSTAYGGQILLSNASAELIRGELAEGITLRDMKENRLKGLLNPEHLWQAAVADLPQDFPALQTLNSIPNNLPIQVTSFVGREKEITEVKQLLSTTHLLTLIGSGGAGKTRLSLHVAAEVLDTFKNGVWFIELAPLSDPVLVSCTIASVLGVREEPGRPLITTLMDWLSTKELLLILDNCEHLIEACAKFADELMHASRATRILATSREALGISGESNYRVPSLQTPHPEEKIKIEQFEHYAAVRLFIDRATQSLSTFSVTNANAPAIAQICYRLDGIPLAIELAAARVKGLSVEQIASRLDDRFRLLTGGSRTALPRQRTLQATIDWSYKLLSEEERVLLRRLSVFAGGWTLEAAEQVCGSDGIESIQILELLLRLVDKSLVIADTQEAEPRYHMLETIRQYTREKLDEAGESNLAPDRHLAYFRALAEQAKPHLISSQQFVWFDRLGIEHDNIRAALGWAQHSGAVETGIHLATDLKMFWIYRAYLREPCLALETLLTKPLAADQAQVLVQGHLAAGFLQMFLGNYAAGHAHAEESERLCLQLGLTSKVDLADARNLQLFTYTQLNVEHDPIRARQGFEENLKLFQEAGDRWMIAHTIVFIGDKLQRSGDLPGARQSHEQSLALFRECGDHIRVGQENAALAIIAFEEGKYAEARKRLEEVLSFYRQVCVNLDIPLWMLGVIAIREEDYARAKAWYSECLLFDQQIGVNTQLAECLIGFAGIANAEKRFERAAQVIGAAETEVEARQPPLENFDRAELQRLTTVLREELGDPNFDALADEGRAMTMEQAIAFALEKSDE